MADLSDKTLHTVLPEPETANLSKTLFTIFSIIFLEFLVMGISLGIIPLYVHNTLKYSNVIVGLVFVWLPTAY
ncbi:MAG: hypothetical protein EOP41_05295 [Sphingobacteriaceae bacterium]|nr:MAG: hypothetical protein EOP41_05295 [Sphingobacteriaceae bacterium]